MDASAIYSLALSQLDAIELNMTSPAGDALIQAADAADHQAAIKTLLDVQQARLALGNAALQSIADALKANEGSLVAGTSAVKAALTQLDNLAQILTTISSLVGIVGQIVTLV